MWEIDKGDINIKRKFMRLVFFMNLDINFIKKILLLNGILKCIKIVIFYD